LILRRANADDAPALHDLAQRAYGPYVDRIGRRPAPMKDDYGAEVRDATVFVADEDRRVVGLIVLIETSDHLLVENIAVEPDRQRSGIGRAMLSRAETHARERGLTELRLYTNVVMVENIRLYTRFGYRQTGRRITSTFERVDFSKRLI
jgi:ribosomal protein S18 acetylase RimI-like enzyme